MTDKEKQELFLNQKETLNTLLLHGAISKEQYDFSLNGLITKMDIEDNLKTELDKKSTGC